MSSPRSTCVASQETQTRHSTKPVTPKAHVDHRYSEFVKVASTLQGCICRSTLQPYGQKLVIKIADSRLAALSLGIVNGRESAVHENILDEARILQYLTVHPQCPTSIVKFINFYQSPDAHNLVMEDGGRSLFDFVQRAHKLIQLGHLSISEWHRMIKIIFKQMLEAVEFCHSMNVSHFDISLENFVINDVGIEPKMDRATGNNKIHFCGEKGVQIKLCDFGLAVFFPQIAPMALSPHSASTATQLQSPCNVPCGSMSQSTQFHSRKFVGKSRYWSPELSAHNTFDARSNDIWCLGVCLFMMATGTAPFETASASDNLFCMIINGQIDRVLKSWNLDDRVDDALLALLQSTFKFEAHRATMHQLKSCSWLRQ